MSNICTLYEGHYHYGVAALVNSLYEQGYRGPVYVGYRGELPPWAGQATTNPTSNWPGSRQLQASEGLRLVFLPLDTKHHLTNYKADFMLHLWATDARDAEALFYFDPDIVLNMPWQLFEQWVACGVAMCEDINSPLPENHPIRVFWRQYFAGKGIPLRFKTDTYVNGGFVGVNKANQGFLTMWQAVQDAMAPAIGGLQNSPLHAVDTLPFDPFGKTDQDALNATIEAWDHPVSLVGKDGMAFGKGQSLMSHALGTPKPWRWSTLRQSLAGYPPRRADRDYWHSANGLLQTQPAGAVRWQHITLKLGALIGRFYSRR